MKNFLLADDQAIVRSGLKAVITDSLGGCTFDEASNQTDVISFVKDKTYDIVILDISMEGTDFFQMLGWFRVIAPNTKVLVFTMQSENILGRTCMQLGAWGFVDKRIRPEELVLVIKRVLEGQKYISSTLASSLIDNAHKNRTNPFQNLSPRELEIV
ncbi:MAG TPA: response regulator transcription factor, partial [Flavitalea sp.]|nr:response regulator transcription factor [Flavitalea sp.]